VVPCGTTPGTSAEVENVAAIHRQVFYRPGTDDLAQVSVFGPQEWRRSLDFYGLGDVAELQGNVRANRTGHVYFKVFAGGAFKPALFHLDSISARYEVEKLVVASRAGERLTAFTGSGVGKGNGRASQRAAGWIGNGAYHRSIKGLAETWNR
jgi:hypothetical protein